MHKLSIVVVMVFGLSAIGRLTFAQDDVTGRTNDDFQISKAIGISLAGVNTFTQYSMTDSHGLRYDTMSLLQSPQVRESIGLSADAYADMRATQLEMVEELEALTISAAYNEEHRDKIKARFTEIEQELNEILSSGQIDQLVVERVKVGIEKVGVKYLVDPDVSKTIGLSKKAAESVRDQSSSFLKSLKARRAELLRNANQELVDSLSKSKRTEFDKILDEKAGKKFLAREMFVGHRAERRKSIRLSFKLYSMLRSKAMQRKLELSENQIEQFNEIKRRGSENADSIETLLNGEQKSHIFQLAFDEEIRKFGTVNFISSGILGQQLKLTDEEVDGLFERGKELHAEMLRQLDASSQELAVTKFGVSNELAGKISKLFMSQQ